MEINEISKKEVSKVIDNTITEIEKCRDELNRKCDEAAKDIAELQIRLRASQSSVMANHCVWIAKRTMQPHNYMEEKDGKKRLHENS